MRTIVAQQTAENFRSLYKNCQWVITGLPSQVPTFKNEMGKSGVEEPFGRAICCLAVDLMGF
jgi:hypothetical protein